ncbi:MAG: TIGR03620 family F420-dependent LLM class oxidoreductase [Candidatus Limnocylindrales bacterium]
MIEPGAGRALAKTLGPFGVWSFALQVHTAREAQAAVAELESLGYGAVWIPESVASKEIFSHAAILLAGSQRIVIASGIASIYARDPMAAANGAKALADAYPGRVVHGIGVSHASSVASRGGAYERPLEAMRAYLDGMDAARYSGPAPEIPAPRVLAALGPRMLALAAERTAGAHPYFVPVAHTVRARKALGPDPCLAVEMTAVLETDPVEARRVARLFAVNYLKQPNYANNLRRLGYSDDEVAGEGSDRVIDDVIAWGDADAIVARAKAHLEAGADHVCIQLRGESNADFCLPQYRALAKALF